MGWCRWGRSDFPFFTHFSSFSTHFSSFSTHFSPFSSLSLLLLKDKGKQQQFTAKMGKFTLTPSAPTPCKTSRLFQDEAKKMTGIYM